MRCPWYKAHDWLYDGAQEITYPKRGPFDRRTDEDRTHMTEMEICTQCGLRRERVIDYGW